MGDKGGISDSTRFLFWTRERACIIFFLTELLSGLVVISTRDSLFDSRFSELSDSSASSSRIIASCHSALSCCSSSIFFNSLVAFFAITGFSNWFSLSASLGCFIKTVNLSTIFDVIRLRLNLFVTNWMGARRAVVIPVGIFPIPEKSCSVCSARQRISPLLVSTICTETLSSIDECKTK